MGRQGSSLWWNLAAGLSVTCAVLVTALVVRRELFSSPSRSGQFLSSPEPVENWGDLISSGHRVGAADPIMTIVEFADFECPFCRKFTLEVFNPFLRDNPSDVALIYRHFPLSYHRHAIPAARAADCAASQSRFPEYHDTLYETQDSLGTLDYVALAARVGVEDLQAFKECVDSSDPMPSVAVDTVAAHGIGLRGTPTVLVNGMYFPVPPTRAQLDSIILAARDSN